MTGKKGKGRENYFHHRTAAIGDAFYIFRRSFLRLRVPSLPYCRPCEPHVAPMCTASRRHRRFGVCERFFSVRNNKAMSEELDSNVIIF